MNIDHLLVPARRLGTGALLLAGLLAAAPTASAQISDFDLVHAIPADVFMVTGERTNPERAFLDEHWAGVWEAFEDSGIMEDVMDMVGDFADPGMLEMVTGYVEACGAMCREMEWDAFGGQFVFGQRINTPVLANGDMSVGQNDYIFLFEVEEARADQVWGKFKAWANGMIGMAGQLAGMPLTFTDGEEQGVSVAIFDIGALAPGAPDITFCLLRHGTTIGATIGNDVRGGVIDLLVGAEGATSIADSTSFREAFAQLPEVEDGFEYVDMNILRSQVNSIMSMIGMVLEAEMGSGMEGEAGGMQSEEQMMLGVMNQVMDMVDEGLGLMEYSAAVHRTEGYSVHSTSLAVLAEGVESNRFYPLLGTSRPVEDFASRLPATTTGYSVSGGMDMEGVYDFMLGMVGDFGPMGQMALGEWANMQEQMGFDLRSDVLSWIDGESVSVDFQLNGQPHWVTTMAVTDEAKASEKMGMVMGMIPAMLDMAAQENPMVQMLGVSVTPTRDQRFEGFHEVAIAMAGQSVLCGVHDGAMVFASGGDAIAHLQAVAAGEAEGIAANRELMGMALMPGEGAEVSAASYTDHSGTAAGIADVLSTMSMMGGMVTMGIEEPEMRDAVGEAMRIAGKLGPVIRSIDFYRSSSSLATFDGSAWHTQTVTHYRGPDRPEEHDELPPGEPAGTR